MGKDGGAVSLDMLVEPEAGAGLGHDRCECGLADLERIAAQVVAVQLDQVEGVQEDARIVASVADAIEGCEAVVVAGHRLPIDDAGA
jgi:hypothetical protein